MSRENIIIKGARAHNLKDIDITIPRDKFVVLTGLSGSGKSSLAFDTIYAEGQRRYVESLSAYARQFLGQMDKPDVDSIDGLSPAISIDQKTTSRNPRSTVGTVTEIYDYLRLLFARIGRPHCPEHGVEITAQTVEQMVDRILGYPERTRLQILAPLVQGRKGEHVKLLDEIRGQGYVRVRVDGEVRDLSEEIKLEKNKKHSIEVVIDRIVVKDGIQSRLADSLETALRLAEGRVLVDILDQEELLFSQNLACPVCGFSMPDLEPRMFSFNSPFGACSKCDGLGNQLEVDPDLIVPDPSKSVNEGALEPWNSSTSNYYEQILTCVAKHYDIDMDKPFEELTEKQRNVLLFGSGTEKLHFRYKSDFSTTVRDTYTTFEGVVNNVARRYRETGSDYVRQQLELYMSQKKCPSCKGHRLRPEALAVLINEKTIAYVTDLSVAEAHEFFGSLELTEKEMQIARLILKEIQARLQFLIDVGLDYLTMSRSAGTLSGGEAQRIRLATQIGSSLMGVLYILDEPSIGLHQRDNARLIKTLEHMRNLGNTLIVVEHDEDTMLAADHIIDIGPGAGIHGGQVVSQGTPQEVMEDENSLTGQYLSGRKFIPVPLERRKSNGKWIKVLGAKENNLRNVTLKVPLGVFTCVTGVSGSGKSTLINEILHKALARELHKSKQKPGSFRKIEGIEHLDKVIDIDQSPIGRTPRSNPATYTGVFDDIRDLFAQTNEAKMRGYQKGRFSFNVKGGRCEACRGDGIIKIEMHFLPDVYVPCEVCHGKRYNRETLEVRYKGKNISDVLEMTVEDALEFFKNIPRIHRKLQTLYDVGLGYITLGQPATTLSGGEAQRVKLASELYRRSNGKTLYILDEPTTGLHIDDIDRLLKVLQRLVDAGDSVLVIEHNLDVIKTADHIIDLGPDGGSRGGMIVAEGTPEAVVTVEESYTGQFLAPVLTRDRKRSEARLQIQS
ncbi:excinuclease ABC subunit UvrA [Aneurinibacillus aneurinilyticus]|uniref:UvrABC system protein A n=1 Tax=Aneurinibacillus aneurinilyticus ATCC 12856 TaxID=649747 RepID=U1WQC2_ANEAE|nr:excinuclease ABC subunit UvrA [Aneurinibacillus aneurinilyticus]ERI04498.1 excinuclease ABC, A subunit [Aneurinibacillus aneurinilyticus ATCC 12856]MED0706494.1 excinuclease ABC subunit UvrA [Aneurinibacillus aneurinilyticus]MED0721417.1 excinuclease ABC subunit UvrA [Aneurinibacillus aneurinilyticus]MED0731143.1 excinuclease ABC subunit UvrA [Aneurinibacillus aneurinilyticus]MED0743275.1 excinuclease ABC subunit UvrA [Aneurinibacillus aneurinilyticus]